LHDDFSRHCRVNSHNDIKLLGTMRDRQAAEDMKHFTNHRSHSPNTTSIAPNIAVASASMWPLHMKSIA